MANRTSGARATAAQRARRKQRAGLTHRGTVNGWRERLRADSGQSLVLSIGLVAITLLVISVVLAASAVNLKARQLLAAADGAVIAAVDEFELVEGGDTPRILLDPQNLAQAVHRYLEDTNATERFDGLSVGDIQIMPDGQGASLELRATVSAPLVGWVIPQGIGIHVQSSARTVLSR